MSKKCVVESDADKAAIELQYAQHDEGNDRCVLDLQEATHLLEEAKTTEFNPLLNAKVSAGIFFFMTKI